MALGLPVAASALSPFLGVLVNPMFAAATMSFSAGSAVFNVLRLNRVTLSDRPSCAGSAGRSDARNLLTGVCGIRFARRNA